jgi:peroxiredoxin
MLRSLTLCALLTGSPVAFAAEDAPPPETHAQDVKPIQAGAALPSATLRTVEGLSVDLHSLMEGKPTILIFYRGGWCPFCTKHLAEVAQVQQSLIDMGYQIIAISPDKPEKLKATLESGAVGYQLLSDSSMSFASSLGLAFKVDDATLERYKGYGIDLEAASGESHHLLPVPAVMIVDGQKVVRFVHFNPDYTARLAADPLVAAAREESGR